MIREKLNKSSFLKYNMVALIATSVDFVTLIFLTECLNVWYLLSAISGSTLGGILAFVLERRWTFQKTNDIIYKQAIRFVLVWFVSILLNTVLLYLFVDFLNIQYIISRIIVAGLVSVTFNFFTHKYFIFK